MHSSFIRLNEIISLHPSEDKKSRFHCFWKEFYEIPERVQAFTIIEKELSELDIESWNYFKDEIKILCVTWDKKRGWNQLFEKFNEAKGYCFLKSINCSNIRFIPRSAHNTIETPDLEGYQNTSKILCEVKTINVSDECVFSKNNMTVTSVQNEITLGLKNKLKSTFTKAASQLDYYENSLSVDKYIYIVIEFDDGIDFKDELNIQVRKLYNSLGLVDIVLVIHDELSPHLILNINQARK